MREIGRGEERKIKIQVVGKNIRAEWKINFGE